MLRETFQKNAQDISGPINMVGLGNDVLAAVSGIDTLAPDDLDKAVRDAIAQDMAAADNNTLLGLAGGSVESSNRLELFNKQFRERLVREAKAKQSNYDLLLYDAYINGNLGEFIAGEIFDNMSDEEIDACVIEIEQETGQSFEDYAKDILGDDMPERLPGEDDADYHRRVLKAVTAEIVDPKTGKVKAEYQDDPTARILVRNGRYQEIVQKAEVFDEKMEVAKREGDLEAQEVIVKKVDAEADEGFGVSDSLGRNLNDDDLVTVSSNSQDVHRESNENADANIDDSGAFLSGLGIAVDPIKPAFQAAAIGEAAPETPDQTVNAPEVLSLESDIPKPI